MNKRLLYVDDQDENLVVFQAAFEDDFELITAPSAAEACRILQTVEVPVVVADQRMPGTTGVELFERLRHEHPYTIRIILTGYSDSDAMMAAINRGAVYSFITKPWEREALLSVLLRAFEAYELSIRNTALAERLAQMDRCAELGRLAASVTHEMGNQLVILPMVEWIEEHYGDQKDLLELAQMARETHERLDNLIDEVKSFVRGVGAPTSLSDTCAVSEAVCEVRSFARYDDRIPTDRLELDVADDPFIRCNKSRLQQVLINLLCNAGDAIRDRSFGCIRVQVRSEDGFVVMTVTDNGIGMEPGLLERIWEPFFTTKGEHGTGLGLDISRQIIESHDGTLECESQPGRGTTFTIRLPGLEASNACADDARAVGQPV